MVHGLNDNIDDDADHVWIVGGVEEAIEESNSLKPRFFIEIVPNRRAHTIKKLILQQDQARHHHYNRWSSNISCSHPASK